MAVPVTLTDKGVPVSIQGDIPASAIPFGSPGDPAGPLGPDGKIPSSQLPPLEHDIARAATEAEMLALAVTTPAICIRTDFTPPHVFYLVADPATTLGNWEDTGEFGASTANPSVTVGLTAKNGTADTIMRSDAAPALDQTIVPAWSGIHTFNGSTSQATASVILGNTNPTLRFNNTAAQTDQKTWDLTSSNTQLSITLRNDAGTATGNAYAISRVGGTATQHGFVTGSAFRLVITDTDLSAGTSYAPANAKSLTTKEYVDARAFPGLSAAYAWTGAHTFEQTLAVLPPSGNGIAIAGTNSSGVPSIAAEGAAADISLEIKPKGSAGITLGGPTTVSGLLTTGSFSTSGTATIGLLTVSGTAAIGGNATFGGNVNVAGNLGSAANTSPPSATNSGITIGGAPTWAMASFYDQALTANNRTADLLFISNSIKFRFANDARNAFTDVLSINGGQALGVTGITSTSGSGSWTHTGTHTVIQPNDVYKVWIAKNTTADSQTAPTAIGAASTYLQIGGREWKVNGFGGIGFGYVTGTNVNPPVWVGWEEKVTSSFTNGDFIIATRSTNTNVAPTERLRVTAAGDLQAWSGYVPATPQSLATVADLPVKAADGKNAQAANVNVPDLYVAPTSGLYRVSSYIVISQAATTSSTMPSVTVEYTDATIGAALSELMTNTSTANTVGTHLGGSAVISAQQGTNIGYVTAGYASSGATAMQYAVHMKIEFLG